MFSGNREAEEKARKHVRNAEKALETSAFKFKFKADFFTAACEMQEAAQQYQLARMDSEAKATWKRAGDLRIKDNDHSSAARCYELGKLYDDAVNAYLMEGSIDQAVRCVMRKATEQPDKAIECFEKAIDLYASVDGKEILAGDVFKQLILRILGNKDYPKYFAISNSYIRILKSINQSPFAAKEVLSQVIVNLCRGEIVGAERVMSDPNSLNIEGYLHSAEYAAGDDLITAIKDGDGDLLKKTIQKGAVLYLNNEIIKLAKSLKVAEPIPTKLGQAPPEGDVDSSLM
jgi:tetratricopeptide (TPR) repeat protein